ncbi:MAG TPA: hypothetical protein VGC96_01285, partial [Candidatus Elarobacter sp.]
GTEGGGGESTPPAPLPTAPEPSFIRIGNKGQPLELRANSLGLIKLESDAPDGYLTNNSTSARLTIFSEPAAAVGYRKNTDFKGGRASMSVHLEMGSIGASGSVTVALTDVYNKTFVDKVNYVVVPDEKKPDASGSGKSTINLPRLHRVMRPQWPDHGFNGDSVAKVNEAGVQTDIFINMDNRRLERAIDQADYKETGLNRIRTSYLLNVGLYAYLQRQAEVEQEAALPADVLETYRAAELDRAAQTVIASIMAVSRLDETYASG